ncbi:interleukin 13 [Cricetulus griseus]
MVWSVDLTAGGFCAALDSLTNISSCKPIYKTQRILNGLCDRKASAGNSTEKDLICKASQVLRKFYFPGEVTLCLKNNSRVLKDLRKLFRGISGLFPENVLVEQLVRRGKQQCDAL